MMSPSKAYARPNPKNNQNSFNARQSINQGPIHINAKERPASAIFFANATHTLPEAVQIDEWFESLTQYEDMLEDMAKVSLDPVFKDELNAIDQWFSVLSDPERTAALYNLVQHSSDIQIRFFITILQQMAKTEPLLSTLHEESSKPGESTQFGQQNTNIAGNQRTASVYSSNYDSNRTSSFSNSSNFQNYHSYRNDTENIPGTDEDFRNVSYGLKDSPLDIKTLSSESQGSIFPKNNWQAENSNNNDGFMFGSSSSFLRNRESITKKDTAVPASNLELSSNINPSRWIQNSLHVNTIGIPPENSSSNRKSAFLDRPNSLVEADSNPDWRNKPYSQPSNFPNGIGFTSANSLNPQNINNPNLAGSTSINSSSPRTSSFLLSGGRQSFAEKDHGSIRWSTFSDSLDPYIPVNQDRSPSLSSMLDTQSIGDRRSISNRLSIVLGASRDLNSQIPPPPGVYSQLQQPSSSFRNAQAQNQSQPSYSGNYASQQKKENSYQDSSNKPVSNSNNSGSSSNNYKSSSNIYSIQNNRFPPTETKSNQYSSNQYSTSKGPNESMNSISHTKAQSLIKQKAAGLRVNNSSSSTPSNQFNSSESKNYKPAIKVSEDNETPSLQAKANKPVKQSTDTVDLELLNDVPAWMKSLRLHKYITCFEGMDYKQIVDLDDASLTNLGVLALGARRKMLKVFEAVKLELNN
ncbi:Protein VTS1 [Smittium culicis]|uniref:Protein VTS1 n=1 Tax=Smittium culicis TaxID=133412 RepID=A0A1R1YL83_9FUNG|nr:Protein VTS1 [Smittium culicis]